MALYDEVIPSRLVQDQGEYASADDILLQSDMLEQDVTITRWHKNGKKLKVRVRALDLIAQDEIECASLRKHPATGMWYQHPPTYASETIRRGVIVPALNADQAKRMEQHNPVIIGELVQYIWLMSALDEARLEAHLDEIPPERDTGGGDDQPVGADRR
jgi:hypothetical protein